VTRYLDLFFRFVSVYNTLMKIFFIGSSVYILYLMKIRFRCVHSTNTGFLWKLTSQQSPTQDPSIDTFRIEYILVPCLILSLVFNYKFTFTEILWSFSIWLESLAILPQLFMLQRTGEAETITTHYLAALGLYRTLYIPIWIYRFVEPLFNTV
jgi:ER lumen protein retaining receptor